MTIRLLTVDDYPQMEAVIDTRPHFQSAATDSRWQAGFKENYVRKRFKPGVWWFGYFADDGELIGFHEVRVSGFNPYDFISGVTFTKAGKTNERWQDTNRARVAIELLNYAIDFFEKQGVLKTLWAVGPNPPPGSGRLIETPGSRFTDGTWERAVVGVIEANTFTGDVFIDRDILVGSTLPKDQTVFKFEKKNWVNPNLPPDAPEPTRNMFTGIHPPVVKSSGPVTEP